MTSPLQTPGVYINEVNAFPNSVVPVATAVPVFIGYTMRADYKGKSYLNTAIQIESLQDFRKRHGGCRRLWLDLASGRYAAMRGFAR